MNKLSRFLVFATAISVFLFAFSEGEIERYFSGRFSTDPMPKPGEKIDDITVNLT